MKIISIILAAVLGVAGLTACGSSNDDPDYAAVCVNPRTEERLSDDACDRDDSSFLPYAVFWYMAMNSGRSYPAVGGHVNRSYFRTTAPKSYTTGLPTKGGSSVKSWGSSKYGGFGGSKSNSGRSSGGGTKFGGSSGGGTKFGGGTSTYRRK